MLAIWPGYDYSPRFSTTCHCGHTLRLLSQLVVQLVVRFHRLIARKVIGSRTTSRRSLRLIVRPIADCRDWLHDQLQIATTDCTTNRRLPRLVARPTADCHDWLYDQSQIAATGCTTNRRLPRLVAQPTADCHDSMGLARLLLGDVGCTTNGRLPRLVARPTADCHDWLHDQLQIATTGCTTNCRLPRLVARPTADCHDWLHDQLQIATTLWGWHGLCLGMLACPLQEELAGYLHSLDLQ